MRISDWSSDVCSSDLRHATREATRADEAHEVPLHQCHARAFHRDVRAGAHGDPDVCAGECGCVINTVARHGDDPRSEEHTSELQSLMRISYAVFCLKNKKNTQS